MNTLPSSRRKKLRSKNENRLDSARSLDSGEEVQQKVQQLVALQELRRGELETLKQTMANQKAELAKRNLIDQSRLLDSVIPQDFVRSSYQPLFERLQNKAPCFGQHADIQTLVSTTPNWDAEMAFEVYPPDFLNDIQAAFVSFKEKMDQNKKLFDKLLNLYDSPKNVDYEFMEGTELLNPTIVMEEPKSNIVFRKPQIFQPQTSDDSNKKLRNKSAKSTLEETTPLAQTSAPPTKAVSDKIFQVTPEEIRFSEYEPNQSYELLITVKNVTNNGKKIIILPLLGNRENKKSVFSVENPKFPVMQGEAGFVAPGMSFSFVIRFNAPSIESFRDEFLFRTEEEKVSIPIIAHRTPPQLNLPSIVNFGTILVAQTKKVVFPVTNTGGHSNCRVRLVAEDSQDKDYAFTLSPIEFVIDRGQTVDFEIEYYANTEGRYKQDFIIFFDNFQQTYTIVAESVIPALDIVQIDENRISKTELLNTINLEYESINPGSKRVKQVFIESKANTTLEFVWEIVVEDQNYETMIPRLPEAFPEYEHKYNKTPFSIAPSWGVFTPELSQVPFQVQYAPGALVESISYIARLFIKGVPKVIAEDALKRMSLGPRKQIPLVREESPDIVQIAVADFVLTGSTHLPNVTINPRAVLFPGSLVINEVYSRTVMVSNEGESDVPFVWECEPNVKVDPPVGVLQGQLKAPFTIQYTPASSGRFEQRITLKTLYGSNVSLLCKGEAYGPKLSVERPLLDFGVIQLYEHCRQYITITNSSNTATNWTASVLPVGKIEGDMFIVKPDKGLLEPNSGATLEVTCSAGYLGKVASKIVLAPDHNGPKSTIYLKTNVQCPTISLDTSVFDIGVSYIDVPVRKQFTITNPTIFQVDYQWISLDTPEYIVEFSPRNSTLAPGAQESSEFIYTAKKASKEPLSIKAQCKISGSTTPIYLEIISAVEDLSIEYLISETLQDSDNSALFSKLTPESTPSINFGNSIPIFQTRSMYLLLKNTSLIPSTFTISVSKYQMPVGDGTAGPLQKPGTVPSLLMPGTVPGTAKSTGTANSKKPLLGIGLNTAKTTRIRAASIKEQVEGEGDVTLLTASGHPLAFKVSVDGQRERSSSGKLPPFSVTQISITCLNIMAGDYRDELTINIEGFHSVSIPLKAIVVGSPLSILPNTFGMTSNNGKSVLKWGSVAANAEANTSNQRIIKIKNSSPSDITLNWKFVKWSERDQLVDILWGFTPTNRVTLNFRNHIDEDIPNCPFSINTKTAVVPANKTQEFTLTFNTTEVGAFQVIALAVPKVINRKEGQPALPDTKIFLVAESVQPLLVSSVQKMKIMYPSNHPSNRNPPTQPVVLHNRSKAAISVTLQIEPSNFTIVSATSLRDKLQPLTENNTITGRLRDSQTVYNLAINDGIEVAVAFIPSPQHLEKKEDTIVDGKLSICHGNGHKQIIPIQGGVYHPQLSIEPGVVDMGSVEVGDKSTLSFVVINKTSSDTAWELIHVPVSPSRGGRKTSDGNRTPPQNFDFPLVFKLSNQQGIIYGMDGLNPSTAVITCTFKPEHPVVYRSTFRLTGSLIKSTEVVITGEGKPPTKATL